MENYGEKDRLRYVLTVLPAFFFSILTVLAILWLTLAPKPLGEKPPHLFPGADKIAHAIMFGGLSITILFDWQRKHKWKRIRCIPAMIAGSFSAVFGILIEYAQKWMGLGRGFEVGDVIADTCGAFIFAIFYVSLQIFWVIRS